MITNLPNICTSPVYSSLKFSHTSSHMKSLSSSENKNVKLLVHPTNVKGFRYIVKELPDPNGALSKTMLPSSRVLERLTAPE